MCLTVSLKIKRWIKPEYLKSSHLVSAASNVDPMSDLLDEPTLVDISQWPQVSLPKCYFGNVYLRA